MSDSGSDMNEVDPPWGSLAAEAYLVVHWDPESSESADQQRKGLVKDFIRAGPERSVQGVYPTPAEISSILQPWRTLAQREVAHSDSMGPAVWLRTCYTEGSDQRHDELVKGIDMLLAVDGDHRLLNDPDLYNFGADWQRVFDVLPELLQPSDGDWTYYQEAQCKALEDLTAFAEGGVARAPPKLLENLSSFQGEELEQIVREALQSEVHTAHVVTWIVLEDEKALANGEVAVMFVDAYGRVIRSKRTEVGEASMMGGAWVNCCWDEMDIWEEAVLGEEYQIGGSCGGLLLESIRNS